MRPLIITSLLVFALSHAAAQGDVTARQMMAEAGRWLAQGRQDQALKAYQAALDLAQTDDERAQALVGMANVHRSGGDLEAQLECLQQVVVLPNVSAMLAKNARRQMLLVYEGQEDFTSARALAEKLLAEAGGAEERISIAIDLAQMDLQEDKPAEAARRLEPLLAQAKESHRLPDIYALLIAALTLTNRAKDAAALARQAWREFPERLDIVMHVTDALQERGRTDEATALLQEALLAQPQQQELLRVLYDLHRQTGQMKRLTDWLGKQAKGPGQEIWLGHLARVHEWEGQLPQALEAYQQIVTLKPNNIVLLQSAGQLALRANDTQRAGEWLQQALTLLPHDEALMTLVGEVNLRQGRLQQALALWKQATAYDPNEPQTVRKLGNVLMRYELYEAALEVYREARQASGERTAFAMNMAGAYEKLGQMPEAVREYTVGLTIRDRLQSGLAAVQQLYHLADDEIARPEVVAALQAAHQQGDLPLEGLGVLLYAQALQGEDVTQLLTTLFPPLPVGEGPGVRELGVREDMPVMLRVAQRLESRQLPELALPFYERLLGGTLTDDQAVVTARRIADLRLQTGDWRAALVALQTALKTSGEAGRLSEQRADLALQLGDVLLRYGRQPTEAIGAYEMAIKGGGAMEGPAISRPAVGARNLEPNGGPDNIRPLLAQWGQADALFALGEYDQALEEYRRLLNDDVGAASSRDVFPDFEPRLTRPLPQDDYVAYQRAEALLRQGKYDEAGQQFHKLAAEHADSVYANDALQRVLLIKRLQQDQVGGQAYLQAVKAWAKGDVATAVSAVGSVTGGLGDIGLMLLAEIRVWQGDIPEAVQAYDALLANHADSPQAPRAAFTAAMLLSKQDRAGARSRLQALIDKYPDATEAEEAKVVLQVWERPGSAGL